MMVVNQDSTSLTIVTHTSELEITSTGDPTTIPVWVLSMVMVELGHSILVATKIRQHIEWKLEDRMVITSLPHQLDYEVIRDQLFYVQIVTNSGLTAMVYSREIEIQCHKMLRFTTVITV